VLRVEQNEPSFFLAVPSNVRRFPLPSSSREFNSRPNCLFAPFGHDQVKRPLFLRPPKFPQGTKIFFLSTGSSHFLFRRTRSNFLRFKGGGQFPGAGRISLFSCWEVKRIWSVTALFPEHESFEESRLMTLPRWKSFGISGEGPDIQGATRTLRFSEPRIFRSIPWIMARVFRSESIVSPLFSARR